MFADDSPKARRIFKALQSHASMTVALHNTNNQPMNRIPFGIAPPGISKPLGSLGLVLACLVCFVGTPLMQTRASSQRAPDLSVPAATPSSAIETSHGQIPSNAGQSISRWVATQDWLGPISAVALSPFFGLACLSGIATYGPSTLREHSSLLGVTGPMNNPGLFWTMTFLTILTSLPRWTKLSKPFAMAAEKLEAYSAVIILIALRFTADSGGGSPAQVWIDVPHPLLAAGLVSLPLDLFLAIAMAVNLIVVHTVKLLIDVLIWLIPFPTVDAMLELANKSICGFLLGIYAFSPFLALLINLAIFAVSAVLFFRVKRRLAYLHELMVAPLWAKLLGNPEAHRGRHRVFLVRPFAGYPALTCGELIRDGDGQIHELRLRGWTASQKHVGRLEPANEATTLMADQWVLTVDGTPIALWVRKGAFGASPRTKGETVQANA